MKKKTIWEKIEVVLIVVILGCLIFELISGSPKPYKDEYRTYECDYKATSLLQTKIITTIDDEEVTIKGNIMSILTDPLTMYDSDDNEIAYAGDVYGFISQDDHGIYVGDEFEINMEGEVNFINNTYHLKDENGNVVATIKFNITDTSGALKDKDGNIIATYDSGFMMKDYTVKICDNDICSDTAILMIIASYVSDRSYDE